MSRIGKQPIELPAGVTAQIDGRQVEIKGSRGSLSRELRREVDVEQSDNRLEVSLSGKGDPNEARAFHGMTRALLANMVEGVSSGFQKELEIQGIGWNAQAQTGQLSLSVGFNHPVVMPLPPGIEAQTPSPTQIVVSGIDKQAVGEFAARTRRVRPPEPYKGKGIRYKGELVRRKAGKSFG